MKKDLTGKRRTIRLFILLIIIIIIEVISLSVLLKLKAGEKNRNVNAPSAVKKTPAKYIDDTFFDKSSTEFEASIKYLFDPTLIYKDDIYTGGKSYSKSFDIGDKKEISASIGISATLYIKGLRWQGGYEGMTWEESLDNEVNDYLQLKPGKQTAKMHVWGNTVDQEIELRKIGKRYFAISNDAFHPSASISKTYKTFDGPLNRIISITLSFQPWGGYSDFLTDDYLKTLYSRPELSKAVQSIELILSKI